ncbi:MAG: hypothetical protein ACI88A_005129 [Paraglaciecola sp.]|jgi:hypothetical protein
MLPESEHYMVGYGSLLSHDSRYLFSDINCQAIPLVVDGWQRAWATRSSSVQHTCLGAFKRQGAWLNAALLPITEISPKLKTREAEYSFEALSIEQLSLPDSHQHIDLAALKGKKIWICKNFNSYHANETFPITQSYLDTCLSGCLEIAGEKFAKQFIRSTVGWKTGWINDRMAPIYPRSAQVSQATKQLIDQLLTEEEILKFRS